MSSGKKTTDAKHVELNFESETVAMVIRSLWEAGMELTPNLKREEVVSFFFSMLIMRAH